MEQTVLLVWASCLAVALAGAANSLSGRPVLALAVNSIAATLTLAIFALLEPGVVSQIVRLGGAQSSVLLAPVVMWAVLSGAAGIGGIVRRRRSGGKACLAAAIRSEWRVRG